MAHNKDTVENQDRSKDGIINHRQMWSTRQRDAAVVEAVQDCVRLWRAAAAWICYCKLSFKSVGKCWRGSINALKMGF